jgi:hypothetical protein
MTTKLLSFQDLWGYRSKTPTADAIQPVSLKVEE